MIPRAHHKIAAAAVIAAAATASDASAAITIDGTGPASPYPSAIGLTGLGPIIEDVDVRLNNLDHPFADELDVALVAPGGQGAMLMSDVGSSDGTCTPDLRFDDQAAGPVPADSLPCTGTYLPTDYDDDAFDSDLFPAPAPAGPFQASLSPLKASDPNGTWSLYVMDDTELDGGSIGSWTLHVNTRQAGVVRLSGGIVGAGERAGAVHLRLRRSGGTTLAPLRAGAVSWTAVTCPPYPAFPGGTVPPLPAAALPDSDFAPAQGRVEFGQGEVEKELQIGLADDHVPEPRECIAVKLDSPTGDARLIAPELVWLVISDDDPRASTPSVAIGPAQRVLRRKAVTVRAKSRAYGTLSARGTIALPRAAATAVRLGRASRSVAAEEAVSLKLRLSKKALRAVRRAFERRRILKAKVTVIATDLAGGRAARTVSIKLRR